MPLWRMPLIPLIRTMIELLGNLVERQDRDPCDAAHPLGLGVIEEAVEWRGCGLGRGVVR